MFIVLMSYHWWFCSCSFIYYICNIKDQEVLSVYKSVAIVFSAFNAGIVVNIFFYKRKNISMLLIGLNEHSQRILKHDDFVKIQKESDGIFFGLSIFFIFGLVTGILFVPMFVLEFLQTGDVYFKNIFYELTPYSWGAWITCITQTQSMLWITIGCTVIIFIIAEFVLRIVFFFRIIAKDILNLRLGDIQNEEAEFQKLKLLWEDYSFLQR